MPCGGPDIKLARIRGREVGEKLFVQLINENNLDDITSRDSFLLLPNAKSRWDEAKEKFLSSIEDLFEEDACNGF
jgi:hypothetical protein